MDKLKCTINGEIRMLVLNYPKQIKSPGNHVFISPNNFQQIH